jgi:hypothetical protein
MYDPGEDVGAGNTPSIQGQKKETLDRSLGAHLSLEGVLVNKTRPALDLFGANPSSSMRMYGLVFHLAPLNRSQ